MPSRTQQIEAAKVTIADCENGLRTLYGKQEPQSLDERYSDLRTIKLLHTDRWQAAETLRRLTGEKPAAFKR